MCSAVQKVPPTSIRAMILALRTENARTSRIDLVGLGSRFRICALFLRTGWSLGMLFGRAVPVAT
jgi:hypothetical protein